VATIIKVHRLEPTGEINPKHEDYNLYDFGGHPPEVGDIMLRPVEGGHEVWDVVARYHDPGQPFDAGACLRIIIEPRPMTEREAAIFARPAGRAAE
jgi:hypothetical protein